MKRNMNQIIEKAKSGDKKAFEKLYNETYDRNYYIVFRMMNNEQDTLDVLQETYIKIYTKLDQYEYQGPDSFVAWTGKVASNTALDFLRKKNPILFTEMEQDYEGRITEFDIEDPSQQYRPDIVYDKKETAKMVEEMLNHLSEEQRICILLFYLQEMSIKEIAQLCNCSENTIKSRLHYGRKKIYEQGEIMKKRGITLMSVSPFILMIYALKQEAVSVKAPIIAIKINRDMLKNAVVNLEGANKAAPATAVLGKGSIISKLGIGKVIAIVATGSLGVGLAAGMAIESYRNESVSATAQNTAEEIVTSTGEEITSEKKSGQKTTQKETTEKETTEISTEVSTEPFTENTEISEVQTTTEGTVTEETTMEKSTEKKTSPAADDKVEWDDDYIEWDE